MCSFMVTGDIKFNNLDELYHRILPALRVKTEELKRLKLTHIKEEDVWSYLVNRVWNNKEFLDVYGLVDDIINIDTIKLIEYHKENLYLKNS